ncbi:hypothetical protein CRE_19891 [Caenorhabditis remanei]|uniref:BTB domain-containing protein n=1 Tax=Caenorhabditis remanei TaxID=31234 RepID=E3N302_CAERE|nr:hypothetical protein CRE_19891 [Caenorhabditis remanei]
MKVETYHDRRTDEMRLLIDKRTFTTNKEYLLRQEGILKRLVEVNDETRRETMILDIPGGNPDRFQLILNYHRNGFVDLPQATDDIKTIKDEAIRYGLEGLAMSCDEKIRREEFVAERIQWLARFFRFGLAYNEPVPQSTWIPQAELESAIFRVTTQNYDLAMASEAQFYTQTTGNTFRLRQFFEFIERPKSKYSKWYEFAEILQAHLEDLVETEKRFGTRLKTEKRSEKQIIERKTGAVRRIQIRRIESETFPVHVRTNLEVITVISILSEFGEIVGYHHRPSARFPSPDFMFITYKNRESQRAALQAKHVIDTEGRRVMIRQALPPYNGHKPVYQPYDETLATRNGKANNI